MNSQIQTKKLKTIEPEYNNYFVSSKHPTFENTLFQILLKYTGFMARNFMELLKAIFFCCLIGVFLKNILPLEYKTFGKNSFITGIPFIRSAFLLPPLLLQITLTIMTMGPFYNSKINEKYLISKYLHKLNFLSFPSFIVKLITFYFIYNNFIINVKNEYSFKISGHILAVIFSSSMILNINNVCEHFIKHEIKKKNFTILSKICKFVIYHSLYCLIFTAWIYHNFIECFISLVIAAFYIFFIEVINFDQLILITCFPKLYNSKKTKYFMQYFY